MQNAAAIARFEREMEAVGKLRHPNIVGAYDAGKANGMHFLVMELVDGENLSTIIKQRAPLAVADACELWFVRPPSGWKSRASRAWSIATSSRRTSC